VMNHDNIGWVRTSAASIQHYRRNQTSV